MRPALQKLTQNYAYIYIYIYADIRNSFVKLHVAKLANASANQHSYPPAALHKQKSKQLLMQTLVQLKPCYLHEVREAASRCNMNQHLTQAKYVQSTTVQIFQSCWDAAFAARLAASSLCPILLTL